MVRPPVAAADHSNVDNAHIIHQTNRPQARLAGGGSRRNRLPRSFPQESLTIISACATGVKGEDAKMIPWLQVPVRDPHYCNQK